MICHQMRLEFGLYPGLLGKILFEKLANDPAPPRIQNPVLVLDLKFKNVLCKKGILLLVQYS